MNEHTLPEKDTSHDAGPARRSWGRAAVAAAGTGALALVAVVAWAFWPQSAGPWDAQPGVFEANRLEATVRTVPVADATAAITGKDATSPWLQSLNGPWSFTWSPSLSDAPEDFMDPQVAVTDWDVVEVPHMWQLDGYGDPATGDLVYLNEAHPWQGEERLDPPAIPTDGASVGSYRRDLAIPQDWADHRIVLAFQGVKSAFTVWVNGLEVGYSEDSYAPAEFDVTDMIAPGHNTVAVQVHRWSDGSWLENQDQIDLSGIFRDVEIYATPTTFLDDHTITTDVADDLASATVTIDTDVSGASAASTMVTATLYGPDGTAVGQAQDQGADASLQIDVDDPLLWSAETPHLYSVVYELSNEAGDITETVGTRVGIRELAIVDGVMTLNGMPLDITGVNRGEMHPDTGQVMTEETMRADLIAMRQANITAVRTSHYPAHPQFYALADEIGMYVMDEANVETHELRPFPGNAPEWTAAVTDRVTTTYERDKNHASVLWWSLGNEAGPGDVFQEAADWLREADPNRLVHYQDDSTVADIDGVFYPSVSDVRARAQVSTGRPWIMTEYQMVMGNAVAGMTEYWDAIDTNAEMQGGFIWDWADQAIRVPLDGGFTALPVGDLDHADTYLSYGGDWGDGPTDGAFSLNGLVNPDRVPQPELAAVAAAYAPVTADTSAWAAGTVRVCNEHLFTDLAQLGSRWVVEADGEPTASGGLPWALGPGECGDLAFPSEAHAALAEATENADAVVTLTLTVALAEATAWAEAGHVVTTSQYVVNDPALPTQVEEATETLSVVESGDQLRVTGERVDVQVDQVTGEVTRATLDGVDVIEGGLARDFWRAPTSNDLMNGLADGAYTWQSAVKEPEQVTVTESATAVTVEARYSLNVAGSPPATLVTTVRGNGTIEVEAIYEGSATSREVPAFGTALELPGSFTQIEWWGRGPGASYSDRTEGTSLGRWTSTTDESLFPHVVPQADGNRTQVRWFAVTDTTGQGVLVTALDSPVEASALPASDTAISAARHPHEIDRDGKTYLAVDAAQSGMGFTWGENPVPGYSVNAAEPHRVTFVLSALGAGDDAGSATTALTQ
ncbi:DUF4981 domain-containing protein [Demequina sp. B12]|uniref:glycoside hydrolase family 2 TIM barrel-domain containing protein n=1 Tax=Demequina sp. B12 TaxID=2992757 RepID=UPI00237A7073|nr:glycoside hydrolase family 2 TIM barrel-domain containing protein [Demequina sp. B12]MDE0572653.1 DUF4981 domain-containing protein [Demequina sp. B12]